MPIVYALVARGTVVLAEYTDSTGNFVTIALAILEKIPRQNGKMSYAYDRFLFHYISEDGLVYLCMADEAFGRRLPFAFLEDAKRRFRQMYGTQGLTALAYAMNDEFSSVLAKQMDYFSNSPSADRITSIRSDIDEVKQIMVNNVEKVLERGERVELLIDKTDRLSDKAMTFKKNSRAVKRKMQWKSMKMTIILVIVILIVVYAALCLGCGGVKWPKCVAVVRRNGTKATETLDLDAWAA